MRESTGQAPSTPTDAELNPFVAAAVERVHGGPGSFAGLRRKSYEYHSSFAIEEVRVDLANGGHLELIFKNLGANALLPHARQVRPQFSYAPEREIVVYRDILAPAKLGTAAYYSGLIEPHRGYYWLLLEKVAADELYKVGSFDLWCAVASWLARMHQKLSHIAADARADLPLLNYDEPYWQQWISRVDGVLTNARSSHKRTITTTEVQWLLNKASEAAAVVCNFPATFIHGEFYASNILVASSGIAIRVCPIDWETAGVGSGLVDLATLVSGNWTAPQRQALTCAYYEALGPEMRWCDLRELTVGLQCCRLLQAIKWLGWSPEWQPPAEHRRDWLAEALTLAKELSGTH